MTSVPSTKFTIKVHGDGYGYFERRRGLRHGDPMSPLLVVVLYWWWNLSQESSRKWVICLTSNIILCAKEPSWHTIFLLMSLWCSARAMWVAARVMDTLHHFSEVNRLVVNLDMSNMFIVGADEATKEQLLQLIGFALGTLPIRCLGLPLSSKKWNKIDFHQLVPKIRSLLQCYMPKPCLMLEGYRSLLQCYSNSKIERI